MLFFEFTFSFRHVVFDLGADDTGVDLALKLSLSEIDAITPALEARSAVVSAIESIGGEAADGLL